MTTRIIESFNEADFGTIIEGDSPQKEAIVVKKQRKGVIVKYGMFKYGVIFDVPAFLAFILKQPTSLRNWYVVATEDDPKNGWLDIEFVVGLDGIYKHGEDNAEGIQSPANLVKYLTQVYIRVFNEHYAAFIGFEINEDNLCWACDHRPYKDNGYYKYSWHATTNIQKDNRIFMFANILDEAQFFKTLMAKLVKLADEGEIQASILLRQKQPDPSVYSKNRAFRMLHSSKYSGDTTALKEDSSMNTITTYTDLHYFPIYHSTFNRACVVLPNIKGKRKEGYGVLVGASPKVGNGGISEISSATSSGDLSPIENRTKRLRAINIGARPRFALTEALEKPNTGHSTHFTIRSLPSIERFPGASGILRSFFRRCPREYDVVRYAEENGLIITQVKPWSKTFPNTYLYRFLPSSSKPCPNGVFHRSNGTVIIWKYVSMDLAVEMLSTEGLPTSDYLSGFGKLEHKCLDPDCVNGTITDIKKHYGDHYGFTLTPYWIPIDVIYNVITISSSITPVITWLIRRLVGSESGIKKLIKTTKSWFIWNGVIWEPTRDPSYKISSFLELYVNSLRSNFSKGKVYWLANGQREAVNTMKKLLKCTEFAMEELLRQVRNIAVIQAALTPIEVIFTVATTLIDGPSSEGWLVIGNRYLNLETGKFHSPIPNLYISQIIQTPWRGEDSLEKDLASPLPTLEPFLRELFSDRRENEYSEFISNLQMFLGYSLTGKANLHTVVFLYGSGRNGKGLFCRLLKSVFIGECNTFSLSEDKQLIDPAELYKNCSNIRDFLEMETIEQRLRGSSPGHRAGNSISENISNLITNLDKKIICKNARSAENAHTAQLMGLIGARCVIFDELNAKEELDLAKFKQYTGGDAIVVRAAYNKDTFVIQKPMFTFLVTTNVLPGIAPEPSVVSRIKVIHFNVYFDPLMREDENETRYRKRGNFEKEDIIKSVEMRCDFLRWVLHGAFLFYKHKRINWCKSIINDTNEFWGQSDIFKMFLEDQFDIIEDAEQITAEKIPIMVEQGFYIRSSDFERELTSYYLEKQTPNNQIIPLQRVYQRLLNEYKIFKLRTARGGIKRAVYIFGLKRIAN